MKVYALIFLLLTILAYHLLKRQRERREFKKLKSEVTWEKEKTIRYSPPLPQLLRESKSINIFSIFLVVFLSIFLLIGLLGEAISLNEGVFCCGNFYMFSQPPREEKILYRENFTLTPRENTPSKDIIYYLDTIPPEDLEEILAEEKANLEGILNTPLGKVTISLDPNRKFCANPETLACYFNGKIFLVPQKMKSQGYYRKIIRHELIHHAEEFIALKYENEEMEFN